MTEISDVELLEYTTLKSNFEYFNRKYRKNHKDLEKSCATLNKHLDELTQASRSKQQNIDQIDKILSLIRSLKEKNAVIIRDEKKYASDCSIKLNHLQSLILSDEKAIRNNKKVWNLENEEKYKQQELEPLLSIDYQSFTARFYRMLADYFFIQGKYISAIEIGKNEFSSNLCLIDAYKEALEIKNDLIRGDITSAYSWYQEVSYKLKKTDFSFEFNLRIYEFYLLVKNGKKMEAILHARKYFGNMVQNNIQKSKKVGQAMLLLVMTSIDEIEKNGALYEINESWIVRYVHKVILSYYEFMIPIPFYLAIKAGLSAIKTTYCYEDKKNIDCVVCHPLLNRIARTLPYGKHEHSILSCYVSNTLMNDANPAMVLPNGQVYSKRGIDLLTDDTLTITCPKTGDKFSREAVERLYLV